MAGKHTQKDELQALASVKGIRQILDLMNEQGISEFELENNGFRVRIKRGAVAQPGAEAAELVPTPHFGIAHPVPAVTRAEPAAAETAPEAATPAADEYEGLHLIKSPIVGTFYASTAPDAPPFVQVGDVVKAGQVLCIIEAMKLMNEIESDAAGQIAKILAVNGQPVEYGQALFGLVPEGSK